MKRSQRDEKMDEQNDKENSELSTVMERSDVLLLRSKLRRLREKEGDMQQDS